MPLLIDLQGFLTWALKSLPQIKKYYIFHKLCNKFMRFLLPTPSLSSQQNTKFALNPNKNRYQLQILFMLPFLWEEK